MYKTITLNARKPIIATSAAWLLTTVPLQKKIKYGECIQGINGDYYYRLRTGGRRSATVSVFPSLSTLITIERSDFRP